MQRKFTLILSLFLVIGLVFPLEAQRKKKDKDKDKTETTSEKKEKSPLASGNFSGIKMRSIGPAFMSGRIADIAIHPEDDNLWYVAIGSGGVWKTKNAGVTWETIFDSQPVYSIGCVTIDPGNPTTVWVGTGENVGGRHVGYGDGIYRSTDAGKSWKNMGLKTSEHISKIIVHPENSNIVWVAVQGPLWNKGGERGLYKTTDGGETWTRTLGDDEWTGATDLLIDPRNPDRLYCATWDRHRTVAAYMGGGPGTAIYRSEDGGDSWQKLKGGLPGSSMGKIGLAISPMQPDVIYAAIELDRRKGGVYRSADRGNTWRKMSNAVSGGTGPHYYQELYASPHAFDRLYLMDVRIQVSDDGGKNFRRLKEQSKHSDNHAMAFRADDPDYLLVGSDGGLYESFDLAENWRYMENMPTTQFYKVAVDDAEPFYNIYGGTQDNNTQGGPSRTDNVHGIQNSDWEVILFGDGHQPATEPGNPDIVYAEWQQGNLVRVDRTTGETVYIQPQPEAGEDYERYNWDAPILVSSHDPKRLYFASQRVWRSDNRGDSWVAISGDLTRDEERVTLPIMGRQQSYDAAWDVYAMSNYNTITSLAESPLAADLVYAGTDDGLIQVTEDGGTSWRKIEAGSLPGVPSTAFVNDIKADLYDRNTVYVCLDNHKYGDYKPYLLKSTDAGRTWTNMTANLPEKTLVWRIVQDHVDKDLYFLATEFGIYFTVNGGQYWTKLKGGVPTISFRDLAIQKRENDLVGASFGRSFYVLDDYSFLRDVSEEQLKADATLFPLRKAWWYIPRPKLSFWGNGSQGADHYVAKNPPFGAVFTYHLGDGPKTKKAERKKAERKLNKEGQDVPFPGWDALEEERRQEGPQVMLAISDASGQVIRRIKGKSGKGFHRINWDLRYPGYNTVRVGSGGWEGRGLMAPPGTYSATLYRMMDGEVEQLGEPQKFKVERLYKGALQGASEAKMAGFWREIEDLQAAVSATSFSLNEATKRTKAMRTALSRASVAPGELDRRIYELNQQLMDLDEAMNGNDSKNELGEKNNPTISGRLGYAFTATNRSAYGPTVTARRNVDIAKSEFRQIRDQLNQLMEVTMPALEKDIRAAGAPWIEGQPLPKVD